MTIVIDENRTLTLIDSNGSPQGSIISGGTLVKINNNAGVRITNYKAGSLDILLNDVVSTQILPAAAVPFNGDIDDLYNFVLTNFFFKLTGGSGGGLLTASNGLNAVGTDAQWGGLITGDIEHDYDTSYSYLAENMTGYELQGTAAANYTIQFNTILLLATGLGSNVSMIGDTASMTGSSVARMVGGFLHKVEVSPTTGILLQSPNKPITLNGGRIENNILTAGAAVSPSEGNYDILCTVANTVTLPLAPALGTTFRVWCNNFNTTIAAQGAETVDGAASILALGYAVIEVKYFGGGVWLASK